ncbi:MAG: queuosine precursor transporter [Clostridia bacterium]|nr:queuosine precursor transporter [Clostridia bacterium]MBR6742127.1 queuosine precursor transporter [Clostridia bacterium]
MGILSNELLLVITLIVEYGAVLLAYRLFGKAGMFVMTALCTVLANIEVLMLVDAFGIEQTLGNILFACSFLITDILSENESKEDANKAVSIGIFISVLFVLITQSWLLYSPAASDVIHSDIVSVFKGTPRVILAGIAVYAIVQRLDVFLYHRIWAFTEKKSGSKKGFLWLRNNAATVISQLINSFLFNFIAFYGTYPIKTVISISLSCFVIYVVTALLDTPVVYLARKIKKN